MINKFLFFCGALFLLILLSRSMVNSQTIVPESKDKNNITYTFIVDIYDPEKTFNGTTLIPDNYDEDHPRIIEVDMKGKILWEYPVPDNLKGNTNPGFDAERLDNGHILITYSRYGIVEIDYSGNVVWEHRDSKISHDSDRLNNGNTIYVFGGNDTYNDKQVKEVDSNGNMVWSWSARDFFYSDYRDVSFQGWTHINTVIRMDNGHTLVSLRNFDLLAEIGKGGNVVAILGKGILYYPHDPEILSNGNILLANQNPKGRRDIFHKAFEFDPDNNQVIWEYEIQKNRDWPVRDADRLPNGNTLITCSTKVIEVTKEKEIVWQLRLEEITFGLGEAAARGFYKAQRLY